MFVFQRNPYTYQGPASQEMSGHCLLIGSRENYFCYPLPMSTGLGVFLLSCLYLDSRVFHLIFLPFEEEEWESILVSTWQPFSVHFSMYLHSSVWLELLGKKKRSESTQILYKLKNYTGKWKESSMYHRLCRLAVWVVKVPCSQTLSIDQLEWCRMWILEIISVICRRKKQNYKIN